MTRTRQRARIGGHRRACRGMAMLELLLGIALLVVISTAMLGGLVMSRHAFSLEQQAKASDRRDDAAFALSRLFATAFPLSVRTGGRHIVSRFEGLPNAVTFTVLGDGRSLRGGLHAMSVAVERGSLVVDVTPTRETDAAPDPQQTRRVVLCEDVGDIAFRYYGPTHVGERPAWHDEWSGVELQPRLVEMSIAGTGGTAAPTRLVAVLHQG